MTSYLRLPTSCTNSSSQLSPAEPSKPLSIDKTQHDVLLNDILHFNQVATRAPTLQPNPVMTPQDRNPNREKSETLLDGEPISCFVVGGEKRLCFPQVLNAVLRDIRLEEINRALSDLNIHCSRCTKDQLEILKVTGVLPMSATSCGLVTKSDAERLANYLVHSRKPRPKILPKTPEIQKRSIPVKHWCFGGAKGYLYSDLYLNSTAECVECDECKCVFPLDKFVLHSHQSRGEKRACHWGFDSGNWRAYLQLHREAEENADMQNLLKEIKIRFEPPTNIVANFVRPEDQCLKRKSEETLSLMEQVNRAKRMHLVDEASLSSPLLHPVTGQAPFGQQLLCESQAALLAYYQTLLAQTKCQALLAGLQTTGAPGARPTTLPLNAFPPSPILAPPKSSTPTFTSKAAAVAAAAGLLALSGNNNRDSMKNGLKKELKTEEVREKSSERIRVHKPVAQTPHAPEPLKKHLLHQFEEQQKRSSLESPVVGVQWTPTSERARVESDSSSGASDCSEDELSLDRLLSRLVSDKEGLKLIRAKIADSQRSLETKIDALTSQNHILQQEIAYLRNKQTNNNPSAATFPSKKIQA